MEREVRWERMFPDQLEAAFAETPVLYIPYGLCEPHGPQNTLGLDALKAHAICCRAARAGGGIVAPPDYWHIHEVGHYAAWARREVGEVARKWLTAVPPWIHFKHVCYHIRAAEVIGFRAVILLTGHYGPNWQDLKTLVESYPAAGTGAAPWPARLRGERSRLRCRRRLRRGSRRAGRDVAPVVGRADLRRREPAPDAAARAGRGDRAGTSPWGGTRIRRAGASATAWLPTR